MSGEGSELRKISWDEVAEHNSSEALWLVVHDKVYDVTTFMEEVGFIWGLGIGAPVRMGARDEGSCSYGGLGMGAIPVHMGARDGGSCSYGG